MGQDILSLVRLVEDGHLVEREGGPLGDHVDPVEVEIGDNQVDRLGCRPGRFGEALSSAGTPGGTRALVGTDADRRPRRRRGLDREVGPIARFRRVGPLGDSGQLAGVGGIGQAVELLLAITDRRQLGEALTAHVVGPALQHREGEGPPKTGSEVFSQER